MTPPIRVLVVDDSALVRKLLEKALNQDPQIEVVGVARDPYHARDQIVRLRPDVMTLDIEMPRMDGVEFLRRLMPQFPVPTVIVSSLSTRSATLSIDALAAGAVDVVAKPSRNLSRGLDTMIHELKTKVKIASITNVSHHKQQAPPGAIRSAALSQTTHKIVAIGASTGGTEAISRTLKNLPPDFPGIAIVQHMPPGFTKHFAERLNRECALQVKEAEQDDRIYPGRVLIAPGDRHLKVRRSGGQYRAELSDEAKASGHRPSADVLFLSVAKAAGPNAMGVILTGMGRDGATGLLAMRQAGAFNIGQDERSCVVYGMPRAAAELGAVSAAHPLDRIPGALCDRLAQGAA